MLSKEKYDTLVNIVKEITIEDLYTFDISRFSTGVSAEEARYLILLQLFSIKILEAIFDLFVFDFTGCLDSELL